MPADKEMTGFGATVVDETETEGLRIRFVVPEDDSGKPHYYIAINGLNNTQHIYDESCDFGSVQNFFYPFVDSGKTYNGFFYIENEEKEGKPIIGWSVFNATPKGGKGEVQMISDVQFSMQENGDYTLIPAVFQNQIALGDLTSRLGVIAGSYIEGNAEWIGAIDLKRSEAYGQHNVYLDCDFWKDNKPINSFHYFDLADYTDSKGVTRTYRFGGHHFYDFNLPRPDSVWTPATSDDLEKLVGTWECIMHEEWFYDKKYSIYSERLLVIENGDADGIGYSEKFTATKLDGSAFTAAEQNSLKTANGNQGWDFSADNKTGVMGTIELSELQRRSFSEELNNIMLFNGKLMFYPWKSNNDNFCGVFTKR